MRDKVILGIGVLLIILGIYITTPKKPYTKGYYQIELIIDYGSNQSIYKFSFYSNKSLFDLMKERLNISYQNYSFGPFITCINGVCQGNDTYWLYYIDGKLASVGAGSCYIGNCLKNNSVVIWKYQKV